PAAWVGDSLALVFSGAEEVLGAGVSGLLAVTEQPVEFLGGIADGVGALEESYAQKTTAYVGSAWKSIQNLFK
ncbi:MAG: hypothetical protein HYW88_02605, partial [Candidatus Sungbacteria bacterium]|nr:hypothetical protein [Candidatus Sungbacteria bacterium]